VIAADTNVLLRLTLRDDEAQVTRAAALVEVALKRRQDVLINPVVLAEYVWTLARSYRASRAEQASAIRQYLDCPPYRLFEPAVVQNALAAFEGSKADFADCLIGAMNRAEGAEVTYSFDAAAVELATFALPPI
jgi:predicted nucleic-acid-binding protein